MDFAAILPFAIFGGISCLVFALFSLSGGTSRTDRRLEEIRDPGARLRSKDEASVNNVLEKAAPALSKVLEPKSEFEQSELKVRLANAGFNTPNAPQLYLAIKIVMLGVGAFFGAGYGLTIYGFEAGGWMSVAIGAGCGMFLPEAILTLLKMSRQQKIFLQMPDSLDLLVVCVEAGLGLDAAMRRVAEELKNAAPEVCLELNAANMQMQMGRPRREVLRDLGIRTGVDDMRSLAAILIQADRFGSSIAQALRVQSDSMRIKRSQMAEEKAAKTAVKMLFPLVLFIFPGIFVVLVGPAAIMLMNNLLNG